MNSRVRTVKARLGGATAEGAIDASGTPETSQSPRSGAALAMILAVAAGLLVGAAAATLIRGVHPEAADPLATLTAVEQDALVKAVKPMVTTLLTFGSETLDEDLAETASLATPQFAQQYRQLLDTDVRSAVEHTPMESTAKVVEAGVTDADADTADLLLFIRQTANRPGQPRSISLSAVEVRVTHTKGGWRIAALQPVIPEGPS